MRRYKRARRNNHMRLAIVLLITLVLIIAAMGVIYVKYNNKNEDKFAPLQIEGKKEIDSLDGLPEGFSTKIEEIIKEEKTEEKKINKEYVDNDKPKIALTFDDGPWHTTDRLLDILEKYDVKATFFILGQHAEKNPAPLKRAGEMGMEIGNHSYKHTRLTENNFNEFMDEVEKTNDFLLKTIGKKANLLRLPGGAFGYKDEFLKKIPYPIFNWTVDTIDWKTKDTNDIVKIIKEEAKDGSVILIHDIYPTTIDAIEEVIPYLLEQGYDLVTLEELAASRGVTPENGVIYTTYYKKAKETE